MIYHEDLMGFGWFKGMDDNDPECIEDFDEYRTYKNKISKESVIKHFGELDLAACTTPAYDMFTGERITSGLYNDGKFVISADFLHYYKNYDIGIPYEYEDYLVNQLHIK